MKLEISNLLSEDTSKNLNYTVFPSLFRSKEGEIQEVNNLEALALSNLFNRRLVRDKKDTKVIVFGNFLSYPAQRSDRQVESLSCLVLDIDNQDSLSENHKKDLTSTITAGFLISKLEELKIEYLLYTTHSHYLESDSESEKKIPKLRLVIPFDSSLRTEYLETAFDLVLKMLCISKGVDSCGKKVSQPYFLPTCPKEREDDAFIKAKTGLRLSSNFIQEHAKSLVEQKPLQKMKEKCSLKPNKGIELYSFIEKHDLVVNKEKHEEGENIYELRVCPLSSAHDDCSSALGQKSTGEIWFKCHHDSCSGKKWRDVYQKLEPDLYSNKIPYNSWEKRLNALDSRLEYLEPFLDDLSTSGLSSIELDSLFKKISRKYDVTKKAIESRYKKIQQTKGSLKSDSERLAIEALGLVGKTSIIYSDSIFYLWRGGGIWEQVNTEVIKKFIHKASGQIKLSKSVVDSSLSLIRTISFNEVSPFNKEKNLVNFRNGRVDIKDFPEVLIGEHRKEDFLTSLLPVDYDLEARCPRFEDFLTEVFENDSDAQDKRQLLLEILGYCLVPSTRYEKFFFLVGDGANGKSVFLKVLEGMLGAKNVSAIGVSQLDSKFMLAQLLGKYANIVSEVSEGTTIPDGPLKALSSGELITAERKYSDPFEFSPFAKLIFACNQLPFTRDWSNGTRRRARILEFNNTFEGSRCDPFLAEKLLAELPGIVNLALSALADIGKRNDIVEPLSSFEAKKSWMSEINQAERFLEECCWCRNNIKGFEGELSLSKCYETSGSVYLAYQTWARENGISKLLTQQTLTKRLRRFGVEPKKSSRGGVRLLVGLMLKNKQSAQSKVKELFKESI